MFNVAQQCHISAITTINKKVEYSSKYQLWYQNKEGGNTRTNKLGHKFSDYEKNNKASIRGRGKERENEEE